MIKINLLRNLGLQQAGTGVIGASEIVTTDIKRQAAIKAGVMLLMPLFFYFYEAFNISVLEAEVDKILQQVTAIETEKSSFGSAAPRVEQYTKEKQAIEKQLDIVRGLSKNRLREVKALDALQSLVPGRTWFKEIEVNAGVVKLLGFTSTEDGVSELMRALENSVFFSKVVPKSAVQVDTPSGSVKKFELEFKVGKQE